MLLAIIEASPPLPGQTADTGASATKKHGKKTTSNKSEGVPIPTPSHSPSVTGATGQNASQNQAETDEGHAVTITKFPSVSVERDWIDGTMLVLNIGLLVAGFFGVRAALRTLNQVKRQADLMQDQLNDARESGKTASSLAQGTLAAMEAQALALRGQIDVMKQQADDTKLASMETLGAIKRQGDLMDRQLQAMQSQFFQWIEMYNWESGVPLLEPDKFGVRVGLLNSTNYPLTIKTGSIKLIVAGADDFERSFEDTFLPPNVPATVEIRFPISQSDRDKFTDAYFILAVKAVFQYFGPLGDSVARHQTIWGSLFCKKGKQPEFKMTTHETSDRNPEDKNPN